ncbi:GMC oxidoreductase, partial [Tulasnella calospora MUT 4182]
YHPSCTARMAPLGDGGAVDARLRVHGVQGLGIVDASVQPKIVSGHTTGPTIGTAEKAADLIKEDY